MWLKCRLILNIGQLRFREQEASGVLRIFQNIKDLWQFSEAKDKKYPNHLPSNHIESLQVLLLYDSKVKLHFSFQNGSIIIGED
jgi:hypothetical protein